MERAYQQALDGPFSAVQELFPVAQTSTSIYQVQAEHPPGACINKHSVNLATCSTVFHQWQHERTLNGCVAALTLFPSKHR